MRYIERILQPGESLIYTGRIHWIIYLPAALLLVVALVALARAGGASQGMNWVLVAGMCAVVGAGAGISAWIKRWTTEIDVTDRRIVYKRGLIRRHTVEMNMDKVESVDVDQTILGRFLNFGNVTIRGTGAGIEPLFNVEAPLQFRNHVTAR
jgi:uncharacterized membrane protein YdbT with pleckstrin-like domain